MDKDEEKEGMGVGGEGDSSSSKDKKSLFLESFSPIGFPDIDQYKEMLPRSVKRNDLFNCCGLSRTSWIFLTFALLQGILVAGLQIAIAFWGQGKLEEYVECLEESLSNKLNRTVIIPTNSSLPSFGNDKQIYTFFFIALVVYNFVLVLYALARQNIVEVYTFMIINVLSMVYACIQVYQFRGFGNICDKITLVGYLALANVGVLLGFTFLFGSLSLFIFVEFGWKSYVLVECNPTMRYIYKVFWIFLSALKLELLFLVIFSVGQCVLVLGPTNYEFPIAILIAVASILAYPVIYIIVTSESKIGSAGLLLLGCSLIAYFIFKIYRFASGTCPECRKLIAEGMLMRKQILGGIGVTSDLDFGLTRAEDFEHLVMLASINLIFTVFALLVFIHYLFQYNKGMKAHFSKTPFNKFVYELFCKCKKTHNDTKTASS